MKQDLKRAETEIREWVINDRAFKKNMASQIYFLTIVEGYPILFVNYCNSSMPST